MPNTRSASKRAAQTSIPKPCSSAKRVPQSSEFLNFKKALMNLGNADTPVVAELSEMFKELSKQPGFDELQKKLSEDGQKLAKMIFGIPEVTPRPLPKVLFGHPLELASHIFKDVSPLDLLNFATVSKSSRDLVESLSIKVDSISISYCSARARITIRTANQKICDFRIATSRELVEESGRDKTIRRIGDCKFTINRSGHPFANCYVIHCSDLERLARILARFFCGIYRTENLSFCIDGPGEEFMLYVIKNITTRFSRFEIAADVNLTEEEFRVLMEDISVNGHFSMRSNCGYSYDRPFQHKIMSLEMPWKASNLIGLKCEDLALCKLEFSVKDLKAFARNWKEGGGMPQLEKVTLEVELGEETGEETKDQVWTSLESLGFTNQPPLLPLPSEIEHDKPENVLHIQREDGRVASLRFQTHRYNRV